MVNVSTPHLSVCLIPCFLQRYSVDFTSRADEANIPLSTLEADPPAGTTFQNGQFTTAAAIVSDAASSYQHQQGAVVDPDPSHLSQVCRPLKPQMLLQTKPKNQKQHLKWRRSRKVRRWRRTCWRINIFVLQRQTEQELLMLWSNCVPFSFPFLRSVKLNKGSTAWDRFTLCIKHSHPASITDI